jgi:hypothetical protein
MKKILLSAAITAALFAGQAQATVITFHGTAPDLVAAKAGTNSEIWISGSSAATPFVEKSVLADCVGGLAYKYANSTTDFTWVCNSSIAAGTINIVHKRDGGGSVTAIDSAQGVALPTYATTTSLDTAIACTAPVVGTAGTCTGATIVAAAHPGDINLADVDAAQFENVQNGGKTGAGSLGNSSVATQIYGVVVNTRLRNAMQVASIAAGTLNANCTLAANIESEACMPSLTTPQISAIFGANRVTDWWNLYFGGTDNVLESLAGVQAAADLPTNTDIHICSRTAGSGTLATFNVKFENQCFSGNEALTTTAGQTIKPETDGLAGNQKVLHSMSGSSDLENCLIGLNNGAAQGTFTPFPAQTNGAGFRWAIGIMGTDRNAAGTLTGTPAKAYRFVKIDGAAPSAANVVNGKYKFWSELANVANATAFSNPTGAALTADILANLGIPSQIAALNVTHNFGLSGFLAKAVNTNVALLPTYDLAIAPGTLINGAFDSARPVNLYTHATATGLALNHCRAPSIPTGARAIQAFNK